jgi:hypothetical protein
MGPRVDNLTEEIKKSITIVLVSTLQAHSTQLQMIIKCVTGSSTTILYNDTLYIQISWNLTLIIVNTTIQYTSID